MQLRGPCGLLRWALPQKVQLADLDPDRGVNALHEISGRMSLNTGAVSGWVDEKAFPWVPECRAGCSKSFYEHLGVGPGADPV